MFTNYKKIAYSTSENPDKDISQPRKNAPFAVISTNLNLWYATNQYHHTSQWKNFLLNQILDCANYGTYLVTCRLRHKNIYRSKHKQIFKTLVPPQIYLESI